MNSVQISMNRVIALHNCLLVQIAYLIDNLSTFIYLCLRSHIEVAIHNGTFNTAVNIKHSKDIIGTVRIQVNNIDTTCIF